MSSNDTNIKESNTLENKHLKKIKYIKNEKDKYNIYIKELNKINMELDDLDIKRENNIIIDFENRVKLLNKKDELHDKINKIDTNMEELNYYDLTGELLSKYYEIRHKPEENNHQVINIMDFFKSNEVKKKNNNNINKSKLFEKYCNRVDGIRVNKDDGSNRIKYCEYCNIEKTLEISTSSYTCSKCGIMEYVLIDEDRIIKEYSPYERKNHFKDWLKQIQAKENVEISEEIFEKIIKELNKNKYSLNKSNITRHTIQKILQRLGYSKLYKHIPFIINKITGRQAPVINKEHEDQFIKMFEMIQEPWELFKPKNRKNFISYPYILYKFCELLELEYILKHLPMLDSPNLSVPDMVWKKICNHLKWEFYPTE
jgi:hypothetical protein